MKFFCEYCGCRIDGDIDDKCPNCGASYKKNKTFLKLEEEKKKNNDQNRELLNNVASTVVKSFSFSKYFIIVPIIVFIGIFITIVSVIITNFNIRPDDTNIDQTNNIEQEVTVGFDEYGETKEYRAKVTKYETVEFWHKQPAEGYEFVKFYLQVENLTDSQITHEDVNCIVDGIAQKNDFSSGYSDLPFFINKGLTVTGTSTFEVPKNAISYDIKYGDYITIHIEK